ncbi:MFS transporter [Deferribacter thermophilus]|uniref:MFS transporter n=1 Tax=Deferribacter thermophilus TaxID=53573 RepID=UPI003C2685D5
MTNIRLFILLRVLYNARFYYPVFTVLFLDYGLTVEQFAILNVVWALTIVLAEVPSGALADIFGRKRLLVSTCLIMIIELSLIAFVPVGNMKLVFFVFLINRILSGLAEAMASGADEAIAYDTLVLNKMTDEWGKVLEVQMKLQSIAFIIAMTLGSLVYDPNIINKVFNFIGMDYTFTQKQTMRFPIYLTLISSIIAFISVLKMEEPGINKSYLDDIKGFFNTSVITLKHTLATGKWILKTPFVLSIIMMGMLFDHSIRMVVTLTSQYYRLIKIPDAIFGLISSAIYIIGLFIPKLSRVMTERYTVMKNILFLAILTIIGFYGISLFIPIFGIIPMIILFAAFMINGFFLSNYLNEETPSDIRATVLSFKGLTYNLAYGLIGILYSFFYGVYKERIIIVKPEISLQSAENITFIASIGWFKWYFIFLFIIIFISTYSVFKNYKS